VVEALAKRDAAAAVRRMTEHLANVERQLVREDQPEMPQTLAAVFSA
jgi:DNA-binding GntR family transcriptional regulator